ncbi:MAG: HAD family phosphatase [Clostridiales bacterium]|nr:HAD family phosphatase [Clostridiales bacterium]
MNKKYAIFDMDGTLIDSMPYWERLASDYLVSKGAGAITPELFERIIPMTMKESAALFIRELGLSGTPESVAREMYEMIENRYRNDIPLKPGVREYLIKLRRDGVRMGVASATAEPLLRLCLGRLGVLDCFEFLLSCEMVGAGKKQPDIYLEAARRLGSLPEETAVFEDAFFAAQTAANAGFYVVGIYDKSSDESWESMKKVANETIQDFRFAHQ